MASENGEERTTGNAANIPGRRLASWINSFCEWTKGNPAPELLREWAGVSCVAGALERRVWVETTGNRLFPNMFVMLVAPPGVGKDRAIDPMRELWRSTKTLKIAPTALTHKGLMDELADSKNTRTVHLPGGIIDTFQSLLVAAPELGVILPEYDLGYLSMLNDLFMCYDVFHERIRGRAEPTTITRPHIHMVTGTQPKYLAKFLPPEAFGMGFTARVMFVYAGEAIRVSLFKKAATNKALHEDLIADLNTIIKLNGEFSFSKEAQDAIEHWHLVDCLKDGPTHTRLQHYNTRRVLHLLKVCMVFSAARSNSREIILDDFEKALDLLHRTAAVMPQIFREMVSDTGQTQVEEAFHYILQEHMRTNKPVPEHRVIHFLAARVPLNQITQLIEIMLNAGMLRLDLTQALPPGRRLLIPVSLGISEDL